MATKSILKNINIKEKRLGQSLVNALENASDKTAKVVVLNKACREIKKDKIKTLFETSK